MFDQALFESLMIPKQFKKPPKVRRSIMTMADSYKYTHAPQLPQGTGYSFSYISSRGGKYEKLLVIGIQRFLKKYLSKRFTLADIDYAQWLVNRHIPGGGAKGTFNREGWVRMLMKHGGRLPVEIRSVPEGTVVPYKNVILTIVNTDPEFPWLPSFLETALLKAVWYPTQVATTSWRIRNIIKKFLEETGDVAGLAFKLHDFGYRGTSSEETAGIGGMAHLATGFMGTDTLPALIEVDEVYGDLDPAGFSIPASEHSTMTVLGPGEGEIKQMKNFLDAFANEYDIIACVSDGFDIYNATSHNWGEILRPQILASKAMLVIRPDSGDALEVNTRLIKILDEKFGHTVNDKGFKVLKNVRLIQGDGVDESTVYAILMAFQAMGYSADNIAFGMGGALLQNHARDDNKWAMKCSAICIDGVWRDVAKDPITDPGKKSLKGRLILQEKMGGFITARAEEYENDGEAQNLLKVAYRDGKIFFKEKFATVRARVATQ